MTNEELTEKYKDRITDPIEMQGVMNVNYRPHPYTVGPKHIKHAHDNHGGLLGDETVKEVPCAAEGCGLPYEEHTFDRVMFVKLTRACTSDEVQSVLKLVADDAESDKIDGFGFVETPEKFRMQD
jgi:hypothetical protein